MNCSINKSTRKNLLKIIFLFLILCQVSLFAQISIVTSRSSSNRVDEIKLKNIYAGNVLNWENGNKITLVDQPETELGEQFYKNFMGVASNIVVIKWSKLVTQGTADAPKKVTSSFAVKNLVSRDPNSIGYISTEDLDSTVKEIFRIE